MRSRYIPAIAGMAILIVLVASFFCYSSSDSGSGGFVILHTNDTHCSYGDDASVGFSTVRSLLDSETEKGNTVFLIDAGDFCAGNVYGTYTRGWSSVEVMNTVGYDLGIPGNHELDFGYERMLELAEGLNYPLICSNLVHSSTGESVFPEYTVLEKGGIKLGCFGLLTPEVNDDVMKSLLGDLKVTDPCESAERMVGILRGMDVDMVVAVGHIGVDPNSDLRSDMICSRVPGIDLFIDGHSHTMMENGKVIDSGTELVPSGTVIASTGSGFQAVGEVFARGGSIDARLYVGPGIGNPDVDGKISEVCGKVDAELSSVIGYTEIYLDGTREHVRTGETGLCDLTADAIRSVTGTDISLFNASSVKRSISIGDIRISDIYTAFPYDNRLVTLVVSGQILKNCIEFGLSTDRPDNGNFYHVSGLSFEYDLSRDPGDRVVSINVGNSNIDLSSEYTLTTIDYLVESAGNNSLLVEDVVYHQITFKDAVIRYISELGIIDESDIEGGRMIQIG